MSDQPNPSCETCRFWDRVSPDSPRGESYGTCSNREMFYSTEDEMKAGSIDLEWLTHRVSGILVEVYTNDRFVCVHHAYRHISEAIEALKAENKDLRFEKMAEALKFERGCVKMLLEDQKRLKTENKRLASEIEALKTVGWNPGSVPRGCMTCGGLGVVATGYYVHHIATCLDCKGTGIIWSRDETRLQAKEPTND